MQGQGAAGSQASSAQFVVAVFDDWNTLHTVLVEMESESAPRPAALLHSRGDVPPDLLALSLLRQMTQLRFERSGRHVACTVGQLAEALSSRVAKGARTFAEALRDWLGSTQAKQLETHLERGHLVLCVELRTSEDFAIVCGRLVQASPHMVEVCNVTFE
jgi:hypothetical protein